MSTDTLTAKFNLTSDFQTIQWFRRTLADQFHQSQLCSLLSDTLYPTPVDLWITFLFVPSYPQAPQSLLL